MLTKRVAFSGSRDFTGVIAVLDLLRKLNAEGPFEIAVGDAKAGLDAHLRTLCEFQPLPNLERWTVEVCHWPRDPSTKQQRWAAAHERNGRVVRDADVLFAFYGVDGATPGTTDAIGWAKELEIEYHVYHQHLHRWNP